MSLNINPAPSTFLQKSFISADLDSTIMFQFISGIYIGVYAIAVRFYLKKEHTTSTQKRIVLGALTGLFVSLMGTTAIQWYFLTLVFRGWAGSRLDMFFAVTQSPPQFLIILTDCLGNLGFILADGLMVWRCFHATSGRSILHRVLPMCLFVLQTALFITDDAWDAVINAVPSHETVYFGQIADYITIASITMGAVTNLTTTFIIGHQIYSKTAQDRRARRRYQHIVNVLIQSCTIYTIAAVFDAIFGLLGTFYQNEKMTDFSYIAVSYNDFLLSAASAFAPTIMVARLTIVPQVPGVEETTATIPSELQNQ